MKALLFILFGVCISLGGCKDSKNCKDINWLSGAFVINQINTIDNHSRYTPPDAMLHNFTLDNNFKEFSKIDKMRFFTVVCIFTTLDAGSATIFVQSVEKYDLKNELIQYWKKQYINNENQEKWMKDKITKAISLLNRK